MIDLSDTPLHMRLCLQPMGQEVEGPRLVGLKDLGCEGMAHQPALGEQAGLQGIDPPP